MTQALALRSFSREKLGHWRQVAHKRESIQFQWLGQSWRMRLSALNMPRERLSEIGLDWGGARVLFRCDEAWLAQVARAALGTDDEHILHDEWRSIVLEAAFAEVSEMIEQTTRKRFVMSDSAGDPVTREWEKFSIELESDEQVTLSEIWLDPLGLGFLANAVRDLPTAVTDWSSWRDLPIRVKFVIGTTRLPLTALAGIERRDIIVLDECMTNSQFDEIVVEFGGSFVATASVAGRNLTIIEALGKSMDEIDDGDLEQQVAYGDLSVRLSFDLGERSISLGELLTIGPGHVFDMGRELRHAVFIRANGKVLGEGELVDIDGQVGVAVLRLEPPAASGS